MYEQWLEVELLDNVVVSADSTTEGGHRSLDYLPGSVFMGVAAARHFQEKPFGAKAFLSGQLRFSPAMPLVDGKLALPMPLSFHIPKAASLPCQLINGLDQSPPGLQREQLRQGAVTLGRKRVLRHTVSRRRDLKSATDRARFGSPREGQLFDYESIVQGQRFALRVQADTDLLPKAEFDRLIATLTREEGINLGRSRSAEYGRGRLRPLSPPPLPKARLPEDDDGQNPETSLAKQVVFYLLSDLALFRDGCPTLQPRPEEFGLPPQTPFLPGQSFLLTRRYAPWNSYHHGWEMERQVIIRGSVLTFGLPQPLTGVELASIEEGLAAGVGGFRQDGLGWVIVNPPLVVAPPRDLDEADVGRDDKPEEPALASAPLIDLVRRRMRREEVSAASLSWGASWAEKWWKLHLRLRQDDQQPPGKSQWGAIRALTLKAGDDADSLKIAIQKFCHDARRKQWWEAGLGAVTMAAKLEETFTLGLDGAVQVRAIHHAAVEMSRRFDRTDHTEKEEK